MSLERIIKTCIQHGETEHFIDNKNYARCKKCSSEKVQRRRSLIKLSAIEYGGGKCQICGYDKCIDALEFHHLDPTKKEFSIGSTNITRSWDKVKIELEKCQLICANCHRELHFNERILKTPGKDISRLIKCHQCQQEFKLSKGHQMFCSYECRNLARRKITNRPSLQQLQQDIENLGILNTANKYSVVKKTIKNWIKDLKNESSS